GLPRRLPGVRRGSLPAVLAAPLSRLPGAGLPRLRLRLPARIRRQAPRPSGRLRRLQGGELPHLPQPRRSAPRRGHVAAPTGSCRSRVELIPCLTKGSAPRAMDIKRFIQGLVSDREYAGQLVHVETLPERDAVHQDTERPLAPEIRAALDAAGIGRLYVHQAKAIDA